MINLKERVSAIPNQANVTKRADGITYWFLDNAAPDEVSSEGFKVIYKRTLDNGGVEGQWCIPNDLVLVYLFQLNNTRVWQVKRFKTAKHFNTATEKVCQTYGIENTKPYLAKEDKKSA
jgi:hypothetical protein